MCTKSNSTHTIVGSGVYTRAYNCMFDKYKTRLMSRHREATTFPLIPQGVQPLGLQACNNKQCLVDSCMANRLQSYYILVIMKKKKNTMEEVPSLRILKTKN